MSLGINYKICKEAKCKYYVELEVGIEYCKKLKCRKDERYFGTLIFMNCPVPEDCPEKTLQVLIIEYDAPKCEKCKEVKNVNVY